MRPARARSSGLAASCHVRSSVDFITNTFECEFLVHTGDCLMGGVELLRSKAEECLEEAGAISDRQRARLLLVQAHNYLKYAEETEAQQLSARQVSASMYDRP